MSRDGPLEMHPTHPTAFMAEVMLPPERPTLPAISSDNELLQAYYNSREKDGFMYAYRIPGMNSVAQSSGRLIRSENDRGLLILVGQRFTLDEYQRLLPADITATAITCTGADDYANLLQQVEFNS